MKTLLASALVVGSMVVGLAFDARISITLLSCSIIILCLAYNYDRPLGGAGAFVFGFTLFFAGRPLYISLTGEHHRVSNMFNSLFPLPVLYEAQCWAAAGILCFIGGTYAAQHNFRRFWQDRFKKNNLYRVASVTDSTLIGLALLSLGSLGILAVLSSFGRGGLYGAEQGAYLYQLPMLLHGIVIIGVVLSYERYRATKSAQSVVFLAVLGVLFLLYTHMMRDLTLFRAFYLSGFLTAAFACLLIRKQRLTMKWAIIPIIISLPLFKFLGAHRTVDTEQLADELVDYAEEETLTETYINFFSAKGDMNMFDTFVAAYNYTPSFRPYAVSWLYVPVHFVPRAWWSGKPARGITMDLAFLRKAPYSPGLVGFFLLDGGIFWMLGSMLLLGMLVCALDFYLMTMPRTALSATLMGVATVYGLYLPRYLLWQYFYGMLFVMLPAVIVCHYVMRSRRHKVARRHTGHTMQDTTLVMTDRRRGG